jgi:hypothetical protein
MVSYDPLSEQKRYEIRQQVRKYLEGSIDEIDVSQKDLEGPMGHIAQLSS